MKEIIAHIEKPHIEVTFVNGLLRGKSGKRWPEWPQWKPWPVYNDNKLKKSLANKVDKKPGYGLSKNDYSDEEKEKVKKVDGKIGVTGQWLWTVSSHIRQTHNSAASDFVLNVKNGVGVLHLDIWIGEWNNVVWMLPDDVPTPTSLIEVQAFDGTTCWISWWSRVVHSSGNQNTRYILNIVWIFQ